MRGWIRSGARALFAFALAGMLGQAASAQEPSGPVIYVLGGPSAISDATVARLEQLTGGRVSRLAGNDRYATAAAVSRAHFTTARTVMAASGESYADALSAGPAATALGGPILLLTRDGIPPATEQELRRLAPSRVVIAGGAAAVSRTAEAKLAALGVTVERVSGPDRYATSAALSRLAAPAGAQTVFLTSGRDFADAMSGAAPAAVHGATILLTDPAAVSAAVRAELVRLAPREVVVLGGERAVPTRLAERLRAETGIPYRRVAGADRFVTNTQVSRTFYPRGADVVFLANANRFADAMVVGAVARGGGAGSHHAAPQAHEPGHDGAHGVLLYTHDVPPGGGQDEVQLPPLVQQELTRLETEHREHRRPDPDPTASPSPSASPSASPSPSPAPPAPPAPPPAPNSPPTVDLNGDAAGADVSRTFTGGGPAVAIAPLATAGDADGTLTGATITITPGNRADGNDETLDLPGTVAGITESWNLATGVLTLSGSATPASYQTALRAVTYHNADATATAGARAVTVTLTDGTATTATRTSTVTVVTNSAPVAADHTYTNEPVFVNVLFVSGGGSPAAEAQTAHTLKLLDGATDAQNDTLTVTDLDVTTGQGTVAILDAATGAFSYEPTSSGQHVLTYEISDGSLTDTGTVTIDVDTDKVVFVKSGAAGAGTATSPVGTLAAAQAAAGAGDTIFVSVGDGSAYTGGIALESNQRLVGRPSGLTLTHSGGSVTVVTATATAKPVIGNAGGAGVVMADGATVDGVAVTQTTQAGVTGGAGTATIRNTAVTTTTAKGIDLDTGTYTLSGGVTVTTTTGTAFEQTSGTVTVSGSGNTLATTGGKALDLTGTTVTGGMAFQSISANGGGNAITFSPSNAAATLTVSGVAAAGSGGTIQNVTATAVNATTGSVSLSRMSFTGNDAEAIKLTDAIGFSLTGVTLSGNGAATVPTVHLANLASTASVTNSTFVESAGTMLRVDASSTTPTVTVTGSVFEDTDRASGLHGIHVAPTGTGAVTLTVSTTRFEDLAGNAVHWATGAASGQSTLTFQDNTLLNADGNPDVDDDSPRDTALYLRAGGTTVTTAAITGNTFDDVGSYGWSDFAGVVSASDIELWAEDNATLRATVSGNDLDQSGNWGVAMFLDEDAHGRALVQNNSITSSKFSGIIMRVLSGAEATALHATVVGNTVTGFGDDPSEAGVNLEVTDDFACADLRDNSVDSALNTSADIRLRTLGATGEIEYRLAAVNDDVLTAAEVTARQTSVGATGVVVSGTGAETERTAACLLPADP